jgi:hypothetical protein
LKRQGNFATIGRFGWTEARARFLRRSGTTAQGKMFWPVFALGLQNVAISGSGSHVSVAKRMVDIKLSWITDCGDIGLGEEKAHRDMCNILQLTLNHQQRAHSD